MAKIRMTQTIAGCMDGIHAKKYIAGEEYIIDGDQINQRLANTFLSCNAAELIRERKPLSPPEQTVIEEAPEKKVLSVSEAKTKAAGGSETEKDEDQEPEKPSNTVVKESEVTKPDKIMRVFQLADVLDVSYKKVLELANDLGIKVKAAQSGLTEEESKKIKNHFEKE